MGIKIDSVFKKKVEDGFEFNVLLVGEIFKSTRHHLLFGCVDGRIIVYNGHGGNGNGGGLDSQGNVGGSVGSSSCIEEVLESKGSSIQSLHLADTTKFGGIDIVSGDSHGNIVVFSNHQIIYHDSVGSAVSSLTTHHTINGDFSIVVGDRGGVITSLKPHQPVQWNIKLPCVVEQQRLGFQRESGNDDSDNDSDSNDNNNSDGEGSSSPSNKDKDKDKEKEKEKDEETTFVNNRQSLQASQCIRDIISHRSPDIYNIECSYLAVSDNFSRIHFIDRGHRIYTLETPAPINTMCSGYFDKSIKGKSQIALGCEDGHIYIVGNDFKLNEYCNVGYPITHIYKYNLNNSNSNNNNNVDDHATNTDIDCLLVIGHFHSLKIYQNKSLIGEHMTDDWIHTLSIGDVLNNGDDNIIVIGKLNNSIEYLRTSLF